MKRLLLIILVIFTSIILFTCVYGQDKDLIVVLDSGHGDFDPGAVYDGVKEKELNRAVTNSIKEELIKYDKVKVYVTSHDQDIYLGIGPRADFAGYFDADLFISIHHNASENSNIRGATAFVPSGNYRSELANEATRVATNILKEVTKDTGLINRGTQTQLYNKEEWVFYPNGTLRDFYGIVNRGTLLGIPSFIFEYAFMSNPDDLNFLKNSNNLKTMGIATARAIAESYGLSLRTEGTYDDSSQPKKKQNTLRLEASGIKNVMTFGDPDFTIPTSGGSGNGSLVYSFDTARVFEHIDGKIRIIGADNDVRIQVSKGTDGDYLPTTCSPGNSFQVRVKPKDISLDLSYQYINEELTLHIKALSLVDGFLPLGKVNIYLDDNLIATKSFTSKTISMKIDNPNNQGKIKVLYKDVSVPGIYLDYYNIESSQLSYILVETSPTPKPTFSPLPTNEATDKPLETDTIISPSPSVSDIEPESSSKNSKIIILIIIIIASLALIGLLVFFIIRQIKNKNYEYRSW